MSEILTHQPEVLVAPEEVAAKGNLAWRVIRERPSAAIGAATVLIFILIALFAPLLAPYSPTKQTGEVFCHPSIHHWLGCDDGGVDMLTLMMYGAQVSLIVGFAAAFVAMVLGGGFGIIAGYYGGGTDITLTSITNYFLVIPDVPLMIVIAAIWGASLNHIILVIGLLLWAGTNLVIRAQVRSLRERVYIKRAKSLGARDRRIIFKHILPQIAPLLIANTVLTVAIAIFDETALSFLGLGDPSKISWGKLIENAFNRAAISTGAWWAIVPPGVAVALVILGLLLWGQAIEDALNPRLKVSHLSLKPFRMRQIKVETEVAP